MGLQKFLTSFFSRNQIPPSKLAQQKLQSSRKRLAAMHQSRTSTYQCRTQPSEQEKSHQNVICCGSGVLHLLDTALHYKYHRAFLSFDSLQQSRLHWHQFLSVTSLHVQLLQSDHLLFYELRIQEIIRESFQVLKKI